MASETASQDQLLALIFNLETIDDQHDPSDLLTSESIDGVEAISDLLQRALSQDSMLPGNTWLCLGAGDATSERHFISMMKPHMNPAAQLTVTLVDKHLTPLSNTSWPTDACVTCIDSSHGTRGMIHFLEDAIRTGKKYDGITFFGGDIILSFNPNLARQLPIILSHIINPTGWVVMYIDPTTVETHEEWLKNGFAPLVDPKVLDQKRISLTAMRKIPQ